MTAKEFAELIYKHNQYEFENCNCDDCLFKNVNEYGTITCKIKQLHVWNGDGEDYDCECYTTIDELEKIICDLEGGAIND